MEVEWRRTDPLTSDYLNDLHHRPIAPPREARLSNLWYSDELSVRGEENFERGQL